jgi:hypothetical protein
MNGPGIMVLAKGPPSPRMSAPCQVLSRAREMQGHLEAADSDLSAAKLQKESRTAGFLRLQAVCAS